MNTISVSDLIIEGSGDGGFRAEHALAFAMADTAPEMITVLREAKKLLEVMPRSPETFEVISRINEVLAKATIAAVANAS
jgi:hypothetical protein